MNKLKRPKKLSDYLNSKFLLLLLLILAFFLGNSSWNMYSRSQETKKYLETVEKEYSVLESQYQRAKDDFKYINSETGREREIRSKFDLAREGEKAILIIEEEQSPIQEPKEKTFFEKIKTWFFN